MENWIQCCLAWSVLTPLGCFIWGHHFWRGNPLNQPWGDPTNLTSSNWVASCWLLSKCDAHSSELSDVLQTPATYGCLKPLLSALIDLNFNIALEFSQVKWSIPPQKPPNITQKWDKISNSINFCQAFCSFLFRSLGRDWISYQHRGMGVGIRQIPVSVKYFVKIDVHVYIYILY